MSTGPHAFESVIRPPPELEEERTGLDKFWPQVLAAIQVNGPDDKPDYPARVAAALSRDTIYHLAATRRLDITRVTSGRYEFKRAQVLQATKGHLTKTEVEKRVIEQEKEEQQLAVRALFEKNCAADHPINYGLLVGRFSMWRDGGLVYDPEKEDIWVSDYFEILGTSANLMDEQQAKIVRVIGKDGRPHDRRIAHSRLVSDDKGVCAELADAGLNMDPNRKGKLVQFLALARPQRQIICLEQCGWHQLADGTRAFATDKALTATGRDDIIVNTDKVAPFAQSGTVEEWRYWISEVAGEHHLLVFVISLALAAPLISLSGLLYVVAHLYGPSTRGKTTALLVAASVWGKGVKPDKAGSFVRAWNGTKNGIKAIPIKYRDVLTPIDETKTARKLAAEVAYDLAVGVEDARLHMDGSERKRNVWSGATLSTGENPMLQELEAAGKHIAGGQECRVIDIDASPNGECGLFDGVDKATAKAIADHLGKAAGTYYGVAGPAFIQRVLEFGTEEVMNLIEQEQVAFRNNHTIVPRGSDAQVLRVADIMAVVALAGEAATDMGLTGWQPGAADNAVAQVFGRWLEDRGGEAASEDQRLVKHVAALLELYGRSRFVSISSAKNWMEKNKDGTVTPRHTPADGGEQQRPLEHWGYYERTSGEFWVLPSVFAKEFTYGQKRRTACRVLEQAGWLVTEEKGRDGHATSRRSAPRGQERFYVLRAPTNSQAEKLNPWTPEILVNGHDSGLEIETTRADIIT